MRRIQTLVVMIVVVFLWLAQPELFAVEEGGIG